MAAHRVGPSSPKTPVIDVFSNVSLVPLSTSTITLVSLTSCTLPTIPPELTILFLDSLKLFLLLINEKPYIYIYTERILPLLIALLF